MTARKSTDFVRPSGTGCTISIDAIPGARRTEAVGVNTWRGTLQVKIAAEPRDGAANEELLSFITEKLGLRRNDVLLTKGARSGSKVLFVPMPAEKVRKILGGG